MLRMLKRRRTRFWLVVLLALAAGLTFGVVFLRSLRSPFNQALYEQITLGMTLEDLTILVGASPGCYDVSLDEKFVNMRHEGKITFGNNDYQEVEKEPGVHDYFSRQ